MLGVYFHQCAVAMTCKQLALAGRYLMLEGQHPDTGFNDGSFGLIFGPAQGPRVIQFALRLNY